MSFEAVLKSSAMTAAEIGVFGGSAILANEFAKADKIFKDSNDAEKPWVKYFGGIKFVGGCVAANYIANPWAKLVCMGVAFQGGLEQYNAMQTDPDKKKMIGAGDGDLNSKLEDLAKKYQAGTGGGASGVGDSSYSGVGSEYWQQDTPAGVGWQPSGVGW
jgi:hypothetical protein